MINLTKRYCLSRASIWIIFQQPKKILSQRNVLRAYPGYCFRCRSTAKHINIFTYSRLLLQILENLLPTPSIQQTLSKNQNFQMSHIQIFFLCPAVYIFNLTESFSLNRRSSIPLVFPVFFLSCRFWKIRNSVSQLISPLCNIGSKCKRIHAFLRFHTTTAG